MSFRKRSISLGRRLVKGVSDDPSETSSTSLKRPLSRTEIKMTNFNEE